MFVIIASKVTMRLGRILSCVSMALSMIPVVSRSPVAFITPKHKLETSSSIKLAESAHVLVAGVTLFLTTLLAPIRFQVEIPCDKQPIISIQQSRAVALSEQQLLVDDVWKEVTRQYVDQTFNGLGDTGWRQKRLEAVQKVATLGPDDSDQVYITIRTMLQSLGDPYTRFLTPDQYEALTATYARTSSSLTSLAGIGVQLLGDPRSGHVVVLNAVPDSPAALAGIVPGDVIVQVDGVDVLSATADVVAAKCRGEAGTKVTLSVQHENAAGSPPSTTTQQITVTRAPIKMKSAESSVFRSSRGTKVGLVKMSNFNQQDTLSEVIQGLKDVRSQGASTLVLDLRGNAGGYMPAGVQVAQLFLPQDALIMTELSGRPSVNNNAIQYYTANGIGADTVDPLFVLVDDHTASASEILTAALQDNRRAIVVGPTSRTFGKGRIQNVLGPLADGSGIAVTKAKYLTPNGRDIQGVGIKPDFVKPECQANLSAASCLDELLDQRLNIKL